MYLDDIVEDVLVKVSLQIFHADFIFKDLDADKSLPIILGNDLDVAAHAYRRKWG